MARLIETFTRDTSKKVESPDTSTIKEFLEEDILGQPAAATYWANAIHRILSDAPKLGNGPLLVATEVGPSGCGKTEIVKRVAEFLAGQGASDAPLLRIDCAEFQQDFTVSRLLGSSPNFVGADVTPRLSQSAIDAHAITLPNGKAVTILLFDEIEKAHPKLSEALLGALDAGVITMGNNSKTSIKDCIVVFTSNLGNIEIASHSGESTSFGFLNAEPTKKELSADDKARIRLAAIQLRFPSEQLSRMGGEANTVVFEELSRETVTKILISKLNKLEQVYAAHGTPLDLQLTQAGVDQLLQEGYNVRQGIRPLMTILEQKIVSKLTSLPKSNAQIPIVIDASDGELNLYLSGELQMESNPVERPTAVAKPPARVQEKPQKPKLPQKNDQRQRRTSSIDGTRGISDEERAIYDSMPHGRIDVNGVPLYSFPQLKDQGENRSLQQILFSLKLFNGVDLVSSVEDVEKLGSDYFISGISNQIKPGKIYVEGATICLDPDAKPTDFSEPQTVTIVEGDGPPLLRISMNASDEQIKTGLARWEEMLTKRHEATGLPAQIRELTTRLKSLPLDLKYENYVSRGEFPKAGETRVTMDTREIEFLQRLIPIMEEMNAKNPEKMAELMGSIVRYASPKYSNHRVMHATWSDRTTPLVIAFEYDLQEDAMRRRIVEAVQYVEKEKQP